jgi:Flp pilus assembly protein TadD
MRQEGRHADFYARQAERRLRDDAKARWLTRTAPRATARTVQQQVVLRPIVVASATDRQAHYSCGYGCG